jgi:hypothetical protein
VISAQKEALKMTQDTAENRAASDFTTYGVSLIVLGIVTGDGRTLLENYLKHPPSKADFWVLAVCCTSVFIGFVSGMIGYALRER